MIYITHIRLSSSENSHEHISDVIWRDSSTQETGQSTRQAVVEWILKGNKAYVTDGTRTVEVKVVDANPRYLRTQADGRWTDNLLSLPRF